MGHGDITRSIFDPRKHYSGVQMQQGRVVIDDDWNEQERIARDDMQQSRLHIIGPHGSPDMGFKITGVEITNDGQIDFKILPGTFYLGGVRVELETSEAYRHQSDWLNQPELIDPKPERERFDFVFLEVWEQSVSAVEDSELIEVALGGADTSGRTRVMRRVRIVSDIGTDNCAEAWKEARTHWSESGEGDVAPSCEVLSGARLSVDYAGTQVEGNLCSPAVSGGYLGAENQAVRVQIVDGTHLVWGFDNGSALYRVRLNGSTVTLLTDPKDQTQWPQKHHIVELLPWSSSLPNGEKAAELIGRFANVTRPYNPEEGTFEIGDFIEPNSRGYEWPSPMDPEQSEYFYLRVWERDRISDAPLYEFQQDEPIVLGNTGIRVAVSRDGSLDFLPGDHWIIALRPETPRTVVPWSLEDRRKPHGYRRFRAPLALIHWKPVVSGPGRPAPPPTTPATPDGPGRPGSPPSTGIAQTVLEGFVHDCRRRFRPLTQLECCCSIRVGDGVRSFGDCDDLQVAIDSLPASGGEICLLQGIHKANARIEGRRNILVSGCGIHTILIPHQKRLKYPIIQIVDSEGIVLKSLELDSLGGGGISVTDTGNGAFATRDIEITGNKIVAYLYGISVKGGSDVLIRENKIRMLDKAGGGVGIYLFGTDALIDRNDVGVVPAEVGPPEQPPDSKPADPIDPCVKIEDIYAMFPKYFLYIAHLWNFAFTLIPTRPYNALGGIQIAAGAQRVKARDNQIRGGAGNGVTLGGHTLHEEITSNTANSSETHVLQITNDHGQRIQVTAFLEGTSQALGDIPLTFLNASNGEVTGGVTQANGILRIYNPGLGDYEVSTDSSEYEISDVVVADINYQYVVLLTKLSGDSKATKSQFLRDVAILTNDIFGMEGDGIGVAQFFELERDQEIVNVVGLLIEGNCIAQCGGTPRTMPTPAMVYQAGHGGVALAAAEQLIIRDNQILENGRQNGGPVCGVFVLYGQEIIIESNVIKGNGQVSTEPQRGHKGGIVIANAVPIASDGPGSRKGDEQLKTASSEAVKFDGRDTIFGQSPGQGLDPARPAARIHGNVVVSPIGKALTLVGAGSFSVCNNYFASESLEKLDIASLETSREPVWDLSVFVEAVLVLNWSGFLVFKELMAVSNKYPADDYGHLLQQALTSGKVLFNNNQVILSAAVVDSGESKTPLASGEYTQ